MDKPLINLNILTTRSNHQVANLAKSLHELGAKTINLPTIKIESPKNTTELTALCSTLTASDWAIFVSVNAVKNTTKCWPENFCFKKSFCGRTCHC